MKRFSILGSVLAVCALLSSSALGAKDPGPGCQAAKLKAAGKKVQQKLNCHGNALKKGTAVDANCLAKADAAFIKAFEKAEKKIACAGQPDTMEAEVDALVGAALSDVTAKRVFVSSTTSNGNLGGLAGADATCQGLAAAAGLSGTYKAWVSTRTTSAASRLTQAAVPYVLADGTKVADDWSDLTDASLDHAIDRTEAGALASGAAVWTATTTDGSYDPADVGDCNTWTSGSNAVEASEGVSDQTDFGWTIEFTQLCDATFLHLYCFEQ